MMNLEEKLVMNDGVGAGCELHGAVAERVPCAKLTYLFEAFDKEGNFLWAETVENLVTNVGRDDVLDKYFKGAAYTATWFVGLKGAGAPAAGDTMASHAGWSEVVAYSQATRPALTLAVVAAQSTNNSASKAVFSINADSTVIAGAFVNSISTKSGSTGVLYSASNFAASRTLGNGDTMNVTVTLNS